MTAIVVLALAGGAAAVWMQPAKQQQQQQQSRFGRGGGDDGPVPVIAALTKRSDVPVYLDGVGTIRALNTVTVRSQVDGKLLSVNYTEGQNVERGYVLAKIDPITYQAAYDQAVAKKALDEATLANARLDLERYTRLVASNSVARQQLDTQKMTVAQQEAQVNLDQAQIDNAKAILDYTQVVAPISGRTGIRQVDQGNIIKASDASGIVVITQLQPISVFFTLPQQQLGAVNRALAGGTLQVDAFGPDNRTVIETGELKVVDNQVDSTTGTIKLKAEFANREMQLWPGGFINVRLLINTLKQVVVTPTAAVQRGPAGTFVYVVEQDNKVAVRPVTVTQQDETQAVITSGLQPDQRVVTTGFARLTAGAQVAVTNAEAAPVPAAEPAQRRRGNGERRERGQQRSEATPSTGQSAQR
ncbi:MAG: efflux RND transporter periplasmic adaptor subunit [Alphaproteobacteria bacterium]|nr:efflux RND transporter periplasmic adaptor subunit [Alphaproteobacteria bacterium]